MTGLDPARNIGREPRPQAEPAFRQLCHLLSLSRTGKVQSAVDNLVLTTLSLDPVVGEGGDPNEVATAVSTYFGVTLDVGDVRLAIEKHLKAGRLIIDRTGDPHCIVLATDTRADLAERIAASVQLEEDVRAEWLSIVAAIAPELDPTELWTALQGYLGQVFSQHGAEAVQLLDSRSEAGGDRGNLLSLLDHAIKAAGLASEQIVAREAVRAFFKTPSAIRLRYMSELLDGTFTFFALTVSDSTADYLKGQIPRLNLFLDTNVVLAVLGMQDNPLQEADLELLDIVERENYPFKLYFHERTLKEIVDILDATRNALRKRTYTPALSRAYLEYYASRGGGFGLETRFHSMNAEQQVDVEAFLARFNHVEDLLRDRGIHRYNQAGAELETTAKGELIAEFSHYLEKRARSGRSPRRYEALDHDISVWMYLQRQRRQTTNALRSGALLLSNDYSLHAFDRKHLMMSPQGKRVATVVLPHHLLQILRPFSRVTTDFDQRFMEIFAAPEFRTTQTNYGPTVSKVLAYLSSFEGVPTETAVHILNDDLLMGRLQDVETTASEFGEIIENAVMHENSSLARELGEMSENLSEAEKAAQAANMKVDEERKAREAGEASARIAEAASEKAVATALAELELTRQREAAEGEARRRAIEQAEAEAAEKAELNRELEQERALRSHAEKVASQSQASSLWLRRSLALTISVGTLIFIGWGPTWLQWRAFLKHPNHTAIQALLMAAVVGTAYVGGGGRHRSFVFAGVVLAALIAVLSLVDVFRQRHSGASIC